MIRKVFKLLVLTVLIAAVVGYLNFGRDLPSYLRSVGHVFSRSIKQGISVDFQLNRARDLLDETAPEMQNNVRVIAEQEVAIAGLRDDIRQGSIALADEKARIQKLRDDLGTDQGRFSYGEFTYSRAELTEELSRRFQDYKAAEANLAEKRSLLDNRQHALAVAEESMDRAREQEAALKTEIDSLEARYQLVQANNPAGDVAMDESKLSEASQTVADVRHELDVCEHMLAEEAKFTQPIPVAAVSEKDLVVAIDAHMAGQPAAIAPAQAAVAAK